MYRSRGAPYFRSSLARAMYDRIQMDEKLKSADKSVWYRCNLELLPEPLCEAFLTLNCDDETEDFLDQCYEKADWFFTQIFHAFFRSLLSWFMTQTSINSWLRRGSMFVFSRQQFQTLLGITGTWKASTLLDLGAGDGNVTAIMAPHFQEVHVTEISSGMRTLLAEKGYKVLDVDYWWDGPDQYDVISLMNLLDRCDRPNTLLKLAKTKLKPSGRILVALVLPFSSYVEVGSRDHRPTEMLPIAGESFEAQVASTVDTVFTPLGLRVERWSRVPYLSEGDLYQTFYWLFDALFVLRPISS